VSGHAFLAHESAAGRRGSALGDGRHRWRGARLRRRQSSCPPSTFMRLAMPRKVDDRKRVAHGRPEFPCTSRADVRRLRRLVEGCRFVGQDPSAAVGPVRFPSGPPTAPGRGALPPSTATCRCPARSR
jgi:hypothetical protein